LAWRLANEEKRARERVAGMDSRPNMPAGYRSMVSEAADRGCRWLRSGDAAGGKSLLYCLYSFIAIYTLYGV